MACIFVLYRDAISKALYSRLFSWLVERINQIICKAEREKSTSLAVLDIFGFEVIGFLTVSSSKAGNMTIYDVSCIIILRTKQIELSRSQIKGRSMMKMSFLSSGY